MKQRAKISRPGPPHCLFPGPAGLAVVNPANPRAATPGRSTAPWGAAVRNAYAYVANQPLTATDPLGLLTTWQDPKQPDPCGSPWEMLDPSCEWFGFGLEGAAELDEVFGGNNSSSGGIAPDTVPITGKIEIEGPACSDPANLGKLAFISANLGDAERLAGQLEVSPSDLLGPSAFETGWGAGRIAQAANNYFSLEVGSYFAYGRLNVPAVVSAAPGHPEFGVYPSPGFLTSGEALVHSPYGPNLLGQSAPAAFAHGLLEGPVFNPSPTYGPELIRFINAVAGLLPCV